MTHLNIIREKLKRLETLDSNLEIFGSKKHRYRLNSTLSYEEILHFENDNGIQLPDGYREFLISMGNGGAGPYYGLEPLQNGRYDDLDYQSPDDLINLSLPFPHTEHWNLAFTNTIDKDGHYQLKDKEYFDNKWAHGMLRIANFGCGVSINLIVNGEEYGHIWVDDRCNDQGIYPDTYFYDQHRLTFLDWYELWLDQSLGKLATK